jgi:Tol biopolymer transport system component
MLLVTTAMAALLAGCASTQQEDQGSQQTPEPTNETLVTPEPTNETSAGHCADKASTVGPQEGVGNVLETLAGLLGEVSRGEVSNGKIVFVRRIAAHTDIYVIDEEGTHETRLTRSAASESAAAWSPDGERIAFLSTSTERNSTEVYVMNADGSGLKRVGGAPLINGAAVWSPDGQNIAFVGYGQSRENSYRASYVALYVINADGTKQTPLIKYDSANSEYEISLGRPSWSPTGNKIAFARSTTPYDASGSADSSAYSPPAPVEELTGIYLINADGTGLCKLASTHDLTDPVWSPDGEKIAFYDNEAITVINTDGSGRKKLIGSSALGTYVLPQQAWSPDGQRIAFIGNSADLDNSADLYVINADGSERRRLANAEDSSSFPTWSPDSKKIAFFCPKDESLGGEGTDLCVINADGSEFTRLVRKVDAVGHYPQIASWGSG